MDQESDQALLRRFAATRDPGPFAEIVRRHSGLVYAACLRVLQDRHRAADAAQETFFQLLQNAATIRETVAGWLHRVATRRAIDLLRREQTHIRQRQMLAQRPPADPPSWQDLSPLIDEALLELAAADREILTRHFLANQTQLSIARQMEISQATVSRRIEVALAQLRRRLQKRGLTIAAGLLASRLAEQAAEAAESVPASVMQELGKIALASQAPPAAGLASGGHLSTAPAKSLALFASVAAKAKLTTVLTVAVGLLGLGGFALYQHYADQATPDGESSPPVHRMDTTPMPARRSAQPPEENKTFWPDLPSETPVETTGQTPADHDDQPAVAGPGNPAVAPAGRESIEPAAQPAAPDIDLSSPEATVRSFVRMAAAGEVEKVLACFVPGGTDYDDMRQIITAAPDDPKFELKRWFTSLDPDAPMPILKTVETDRGLEILWEVTFRTDLELEGRLFRAGDTMQLDARLQKIDEKWLIDGL